MQVNAWGITDRGRVRSQNQDSFYLDVLHEEHQAVLVVCDGMGGAKAGNVASELAVEAFVEDVRGSLKPGINHRYMKNALSQAVSRANAVVYQKAQSKEDYNGMGTTLVGAIVSDDMVAVANVGDSRAYLISEEGISRITRDHSVVEDMLYNGDLTREQARIHPSKNLITRALGTETDLTCDLFALTLRRGDYLLLCSDGLTNVVEDQELLYEVLHGGEPSRSCLQLLEIANARGGPDNITVVILAV